MSFAPRSYILGGVLIVVIIAALVLSTIPPFQTNPTSSLTCPPLPENDALAQDAQHYAADFGVSVEEAICRLTIQNEIGPLGAALRLGEPESYGGLWIHHEPEFGVTVLFTENPEAALAPYVRDSSLAGIIKARRAKVSLRYLEQAQRQAHAVAASTGIPVESGINVPANRVELYVIDVKGLSRALRRAGSRLPDHVTIVKVGQHSSPAS
ncbi:MAG: hypothetical protein OXL37_07525 [Chloroflexota bacterium]|nr:hypothetical protein [Chloroflexota bacterium]MDE2959393.1 hypothetical protein [Chloroflexota bacterium]